MNNPKWFEEFGSLIGEIEAWQHRHAEVSKPHDGELNRIKHDLMRIERCLDPTPIYMKERDK